MRKSGSNSTAVLMNPQHLFPNPYMPDPTCYTNLIETGSSNFLFGFLAVLFLFAPGRQVMKTRAANKAAS